MDSNELSTKYNTHLNSDLELDLFLEAVYRKYGYDFRSYSRASLRRRVNNQVQRLKLKNVSELTHLVIYDDNVFTDIFNYLTVNVTEMFRDPHFYRAFKENIVPFLRSHPSIKIWHAGCSTGEEVYSMCILLKEVGLYEKAQIYGTDIDHAVLDQAKKGIYPADTVASYTRNYLEAGGLYELDKYYTERYNSIIVDSELKKNVVFADHDLVTDQVFSEMQVIVCRNVIIYFNQLLQDRVFRLFSNSLDYGGFLCLGTKESLRFSTSARLYAQVNEKYKIYQKKQQHKPFSLVLTTQEGDHK